MMILTIFDRKTGSEITNGNDILKMSDLETKFNYESFGVQSNGQPVVFDKCGNFGYLDPAKIMVTIDLSE